MDLCQKYRPTLFKQVVGQESVVKILQEKLKNHDLNQAVILSGISGVGKTTIARILATKLRCGEKDLILINAADDRGIETARGIINTVHLEPWQGESRVWILDESHRLTPDFQNALLNLLEEPPKSRYFILCTTDPNKLLKTVKTRCLHLELKPVSLGALLTFIKDILLRENKTLEDNVTAVLVNMAGGSVRQALRLLEGVLACSEREEQLAFLQSSQEKESSYALVQLLCRSSSQWSEAVKLLRDVENEDAEKIRQSILGYARAILLNDPKRAASAYLILNSFRDDFYTTRHAGLAMSVYECLQRNKTK